MKKLNLFIIFAIVIMAGSTALCVSGCSDDEFDDFEDDEVYTLAKKVKRRIIEEGHGSGSCSYGNVADGELLWHKNERTTLIFNIGSIHYSTYEFPLEFNADAVYTLANDSITRNYGAILEWTPSYEYLSIEITGVSATAINYRATFTGAGYNPSVSNPTNADHVQNGSITYQQ